MVQNGMKNNEFQFDQFVLKDMFDKHIEFNKIHTYLTHSVVSLYQYW